MGGSVYFVRNLRKSDYKDLLETNSTLILSQEFLL